MKAVYLLSFGIVLKVCTAFRRHASSETRNASLAESLVEEAGWGEAKCYKVTGGTCRLGRCRAERNAKCSFGTCYCETGCVGADGVCRSNLQEYKLVASNFRLRNNKWQDQYLYTPRTQFFEQLRVTEYKGKYADKWNLYEIPGPTWLPDFQQVMALGGSVNDINWGFGYRVDEPRYILSPAEYPEYAAAIANNDLRITLGVGSLYSVEVYHLSKRHLLADALPFNPSLIFNRLCRPPGSPAAVEIDGLYSTAAWYVHMASWKTYGWMWGDPKAGGHWQMETESGQPIDIPLPPCKYLLQELKESVR